jgi:hypothetical protein
MWGENKENNEKGGEVFPISRKAQIEIIFTTKSLRARSFTKNRNNALAKALRRKSLMSVKICKIRFVCVLCVFTTKALRALRITKFL